MCSQNRSTNMTGSGSSTPPVPKKNAQETKTLCNGPAPTSHARHPRHHDAKNRIRALPRQPAEGLDPHAIEVQEYLHNVIITKVLPVAHLCTNIVRFIVRAQDSGGIIDSAL